MGSELDAEKCMARPSGITHYAVMINGSRVQLECHDAQSVADQLLAMGIEATRPDPRKPGDVMQEVVDELAKDWNGPMAAAELRLTALEAHATAVGSDLHKLHRRTGRTGYYAKQLEDIRTRLAALENMAAAVAMIAVPNPPDTGGGEG